MFFQHTRTSKKIADVRFAHQLTRRLAAVRQQGIMQGLYPDGKAQVAIEYGNNTSIAIADRSIGSRLPMDILVARNFPGKPQTAS